MAVLLLLASGAAVRRERRVRSDGYSDFADQIEMFRNLPAGSAGCPDEAVRRCALGTAHRGLGNLGSVRARAVSNRDRDRIQDSADQDDNDIAGPERFGSAAGPIPMLKPQDTIIVEIDFTCRRGQFLLCACRSHR